MSPTLVILLVGALRGRELRPGRLLPGAAQDGAAGRRHQPRRAARASSSPSCSPAAARRCRWCSAPARSASSPCSWSSCSTAAGRLREDASIGVVFPALFSLGVILISRYAAQVDLDLDCVLYGEIAYAPWDLLLAGERSLGPKALWVTGGVLLASTCCSSLSSTRSSRSRPSTPGWRRRSASRRFSLHYLLMSAVSVTVVGVVRVGGRDPGGGDAGGAAGHGLPADRPAGPDAGASRSGSASPRRRRLLAGALVGRLDRRRHGDRRRRLLRPRPAASRRATACSPAR